MTRYHLTKNGNVPFTAEEEAEFDELQSNAEIKLLEIAAEDIRQKRNEKLSASDWTQVSDAQVDQAAWAFYRQELRDLPSQEGFPNEVAWPTEPVAEEPVAEELVQEEPAVEVVAEVVTEEPVEDVAPE